MTEAARYTRTAVVLHWLIAALMIANVVLGLSVGDDTPETIARRLIDTHKSIGITVFGLASLRLLWRFAHSPPALPGAYAQWERRLSHWVHRLLYALMFLLPVSGWLHDSAWEGAPTHPMSLFGLVPWPRLGWLMTLDPDAKKVYHDLFGGLHELFGYVLYGAFGLHVAGALKHQFVDHVPELQRMKL